MQVNETAWRNTATRAIKEYIRIMAASIQQLKNIKMTALFVYTLDNTEHLHEFPTNTDYRDALGEVGALVGLTSCLC